MSKQASELKPSVGNVELGKAKAPSTTNPIAPAPSPAPETKGGEKANTPVAPLTPKGEGHVELGGSLEDDSIIKTRDDVNNAVKNVTDKLKKNLERLKYVLQVGNENELEYVNNAAAHVETAVRKLEQGKKE